MGDNDFPAVMANGGEFLQGYTRKRGLISQQEGGELPRGILYASDQVLGGPEIAQVVEFPETPTALGPEVPPAMIREINKRLFPGYDRVRRRLAGLRGV
jgi:hypothetical protein|tara:strand:- start:127 stop:423 length:297 start_codon:yes stop_codon:yes gene_type:complete